MLIFARLCSRRSNLKQIKQGFWGNLKQICHHSVGKYLLITNSFVSGTLMASSDVIQQNLQAYWRERKSCTHDWERTGRMYLIGLILGLPQHFFYAALDRYIPSRKLKSIGLKILLDQLIASPMCLFIFFVGMSILEGRGVSCGIDNFTNKFPTVYVVDWCFWPPTQFINFYFLPPKFRVMYVCFITVLYNCFLSFYYHTYV